jgi:tetratricopeptide (TPR) repeat protein
MTDPEEEYIWNLTERWRWSEAEAAARARLIRHPGSAWTFQALAYSLHQQSRLGEATAAAEEACRLGPADPWNFIVSSRIASSRRAGSQAVSLAQRAVELRPSMWRAHHQMGNALLTHVDAQGSRHFKPEAAIAPLQEALRLAPTAVEVHESLAHAMTALGRRQDSGDAHHAVLALDPNRASALVGLADSYGWWRSATAARHLSTALGLRPNQAPARVHMTWVIDDWMRAMAWTWVTAGALLAPITWFAPKWVGLIAVAVLALVSGIATWSLVRRLPPRGLRELWFQSRHPSTSRLTALAVSVAGVVAIGAAPRLEAVTALLVLGALSIVLCKVDLARLEWRFQVRRQRRRSTTKVTPSS